MIHHLLILGAMNLTEILIPIVAKEVEEECNQQLQQRTKRTNQKLKRKSFRSLLLSRSHKLVLCLKNLPVEGFQVGGQSRLELK